MLAGSEPTTLPYRATAAQASGSLESQDLTLVNRARAAAGLVPLAQYDPLRDVAREYARELFSSGYLSHVSRAGQTLPDRIVAAGIAAHVVGENLAYAADVPQAHEALMASPDHRRNILYPLYRLVGIGVVDGGAKGVVLVEDFTDAVESVGL